MGERVSVGQWWNDFDRDNRDIRRKTCRSAPVSTTYLTWIDLGLITDLCGTKPAAVCLNQGTAGTVF